MVQVFLLWYRPILLVEPALSSETHGRKVIDSLDEQIFQARPLTYQTLGSAYYEPKKQ